MVSIKLFTKMALSFPETTTQPHFDKTSFRVKKKIFATLSTESKQAFVKLSENDQSVFCLFDKTIIYPVPNKWGKQGWTIIELKKVKTAMAADILSTAYCTIAPKSLSQKITLPKEELKKPTIAAPIPKTH